LEEVDLFVQGTLWAQGTAGNPIYFTSVNDSTVGGVSGSGTPDSTDWGWIEFDSSSANCLMEQCVVRYGGNDYYGVNPYGLG
jgi:hypothetical protein